MTQDNAPQTGERIAKVLARAGVGSRREIERMIEAGRIRLNGKVLDTPATLVDGTAGLSVDGQPVSAPEETRLWRLHKRRGVLTTAHDPEGRKTIFDGLPAHMGRVVAVGRLDMNTEGLLLLTNDGGLARWLELPATGLPRTYRVRVYGTLDAQKIANLKDGATIDGVHYGPVQIDASTQTSANTWITVTIHEGKNREVRKLMAHLDLEVTRLIRTQYGPFALGNLALDDVARVPGDQLLKACSGYFDTAAQDGGVTAPKLTSARTGWAKAKPKDKPKPRRKVRKAADDHRDESRKPNADTGGPRGAARKFDTARGDQRSKGHTASGDPRDKDRNARGDQRGRARKPDADPKAGRTKARKSDAEPRTGRGKPRRPRTRS